MAKPKKLSNLELDSLIEYFSYDSSTGLIFWKKDKANYKMDDIAGNKSNRGYIKIKLNKQHYLAHRIAWFLFYNKWPENEIDHINGNTSDNRIENLRDVTISKNQQNQKKHRNGLMIGISKRKHGTWQATAPREYLNHKSDESIYLGTFKTKKEAEKAIIDFCLKENNK